MGGRKDIWKDGIKTQFKKGESGNPEGMKKGTEHSKTRLKRWLELEIEVTNPVTKKKEIATVLEAMDAKMIQKVLNDKDLAAYREILDRFEGKVVNKSEITGKDGEAFIPKSYSFKFVDGSDGRDSD